MSMSKTCSSWFEPAGTLCHAAPVNMSWTVRRVMAPAKLGGPLGRPQAGLLGRGAPSARLLRRPRGSPLLQVSHLTLLGCFLAVGSLLLLLSCSRMGTLISHPSRGGELFHLPHLNCLHSLLSSLVRRAHTLSMWLRVLRCCCVLCVVSTA